ncbi:membrane protein [Sphingomonas sp. DBB INV C78]|uniref:BamA/TamA family outer membrane protein n=1 Tax=Sphingomonas sp. DBB INV C78 TaxID=3349434 RepID=UPI0036D38C1C
MALFRVPRWPLIFSAAMVFATPALADQVNSSIEEMHDNSKAGHGLAKGSDLLIVPIPLSNPTLGTGLSVAGVLFYNPNKAPEPWISGVGAMKTSNGSWAAAAFHDMSLADDRFRIIAFGGYGDINVDFFGIGPGAGDRGVSVKLDQEGIAGLLQGQMRVAKHFYAGARFQFLDLKSTVMRQNPAFPDLELPPVQGKSTTAQIGPSLSYDSRDNSLNPVNGELLTMQWMFNAKALGSDFTSDKMTAAANVYRAAGEGGVLALHASLCAASKGSPFYDLCLYGQSNDLRGYEAGRYRDRASWTVQYEVRQKLSGRFGAVAFAGVGGVASSLSDIGNSKFLPAAGVGLRYRPSRETNVNLRLDYAVGKDSDAIYFAIAEAF